MDIIAELFLLDMRVLEQQEDDDRTVATKDDDDDDNDEEKGPVTLSASITNGTEDDEIATTTTTTMRGATRHHTRATTRELKHERFDRINQRVFLWMGVMTVGFFVVLMLLVLRTNLFECTDNSPGVGEEQAWP